MKKGFALLLVLTMLLALTACGSKNNETNGPDFTVKTPLQPDDSVAAAQQSGESDQSAANDAVLPAEGDAEKPTPNDQAGQKEELEQEIGSGDGDADFSVVPETADKAAYLRDGRLRLISNGLEIIFDIPEDWVFLTQDARGQSEDYELWIENPANFVALLQSYEQNAFALNGSGDEIDLYILQDGFSTYIEDTNYVTEDNVDQIVEELKEDNPDASEIYCTVLGTRVFVVYEYETEGYMIISTVINSISLDFYYIPTDSSGDAQLQELADFLSKMVVRMA